MTSRLLKRLISGALALTLVFNINGFAAVVTDSDGSAFITKAEFDSLKNSFQAQIDSYNTAIDSKIDGAIAAYLAGIKVATRSSKECLVSKYDKVALFTDPDYSYQYARPTWNSYAYSLMTNVTTSQQWNTPEDTDDVWLNQPGAVSWQRTSIGYSLPESANGCKEMVIDELKSDVPGEILPYRYKLRGYYVNVRYEYLAITNLKYTPADGNYHVIHASYFLGSVPYSPGFKYDNIPSGSQYIAQGLFWNYNNTNIGSLKGTGDWYGPLNMVTQGFDSSVLTGSILYDKDLATKTSELASTYFIAYDDTKKFVNFYNKPYYWKKANDNSPTTESSMNFAKDTDGSGHVCIYYGFSGIKNPLTHPELSVANKRAQQKVVYYSNNFKNYANDHGTDVSSQMTLDGDMPIFSGFEKSTPSEIRQMDDNFKNAELPDITVKNISLIGGFPVCIEKKDTKIEWRPRFVDTTKKYRLWFSYTPFTDKPQVDTTGLQRILFSGNKYIDIDNGVGLVSWTMAEDSPVYMKWAILNGSTETVGGVLNLKDCNSYTTINSD